MRLVLLAIFTMLRAHVSLINGDPVVAASHTNHQGTNESFELGSNDLLSTVAVEMKCSASNQTWDPSLSRCCTVCPIGSGMALPCTTTNDTVCAPCSDGESYSTIASHEGVCRPCRRCLSATGQQLVQRCTNASNALCKCRSGYFAYGIAGSHYACRRCRDCSPFGVQYQCRPTSDTVCNNERRVQYANERQGFFENGANLVPFYCAFLGLILVGLAVHVLVKRCQWCRGAPAKLPAPTSQYSAACVGPPTTLCPAQQHLLPPPLPSNTTPPFISVPIADIYRPVSANKKKGNGRSREQSGTSATTALLTARPTDARKISDACISKLESHINGARTASGDQQLWVALAKRLGYSHLVPSITARSQAGGESPSLLLLNHWNADCSSSADALPLLKAFNRLGCSNLNDIVCNDEASRCIAVSF